MYARAVQSAFVLVDELTELIRVKKPLAGPLLSAPENVCLFGSMVDRTQPSADFSSFFVVMGTDEMVNPIPGGDNEISRLSGRVTILVSLYAMLKDKYLEAY